LLPVTREGEGKFQGVCVRLCRFWSSLIWRRVVCYCTGVNREFCCPHCQDVLSHTVCPDDGSNRILYISILLLDCTASYQTRQKKSLRSLFGTAVRRTYFDWRILDRNWRRLHRNVAFIVFS
jgi:hypothetical protein